MRRDRLLPAFVVLCLSIPLVAAANVRVVALQGDPAPGVPAATFTGFPGSLSQGWNTPPICDSLGHCTFYATTSSGVAGLWSDMTGTLAPVVLVGDVLPGASGPDTLLYVGPYLMSDHQQVVFYGIAKHGATTYGLWYKDGSGLTLAAESGEIAPWTGTTQMWDLTLTTFKPLNLAAGPIALNASGRLALQNVVNPSGANGLWTFDPPPVVNRYLCAQTAFVPGFASFNALGPVSMNATSMLAQLNSWYAGSGSAHNGVYQGACALLGAVLADGDLAPAVDGIPGTANITSIGFNFPPDINASNSVAFTSWLVNGGVTSANNTVAWLHDTGGYHAVLRMGGTAPELSGGETLTPNTEGSYVSADEPQLLSDAGSVVLDATVQPSNTAAVMIRRTDGTLHVLARDLAPAPGLVNRSFVIYFNQRGSTGFSLNHSGQVLLETSTRNPLDPYNTSDFRVTVFTTDATGTLTPVVVDQSTYTVRTGLTGVLGLNTVNSPPLASNGTDGRAHDFSNKGEYFFIATFTPGGGSPLSGVFAGGGPDLSLLGVTPGAVSQTRLAAVAPNPFSLGTRVAFDLAQRGHVVVEVFDLAGRRVKTLRDELLSPGHYEDRWQGDDDSGRTVKHGVYFVRLTAADTDIARRVVLLR